jgi:uncharacterized protein YndB with AHSA1/START domain
MAPMQATIEIARPVQQVFAFFEALDRNLMRTDPMIQSVSQTPDGPLRPGPTFRIRQRTLGRVRDQTMRVVSVQPNRWLELEAKLGPVEPRLSLSFEPSADGTRIVFRGDSRPVGLLKVIAPLADRFGERNWRRRLGLIKAALENDRSH